MELKPTSGMTGAAPQREHTLRSESVPEPHDEVLWSDDLDTNWGYGANENRFNGLIRTAVAERWVDTPPLPLILLKSTMAQESGFNPLAASPSNYVGLLQLGTAEARSQGLKLEPVDERTIPEKNVPAGVSILGIKHGVIKRPTELWDAPFAREVQAYYDVNGAPSDRQIWSLSLAAYNGGGGTVLRAMAEAIRRGHDPRDWDNLIQPKNDPESSPLYKAIQESYPGGHDRKYREMANYPVQILRRAGLG